MKTKLLLIFLKAMLVASLFFVAGMVAKNHAVSSVPMPVNAEHTNDFSRVRNVLGVK